MKRIVAAILLIALSVGGSVLVVCCIQEKSDKILKLMERDRELVITSQTTDKNRANEIKEEWESVESFMSAFLPHSEIDSVEIGIRCLENYDEQGLCDEYLETLNDCINTLNHVKESEKILLKNIF